MYYGSPSYIKLFSREISNKVRNVQSTSRIMHWRSGLNYQSNNVVCTFNRYFAIIQILRDNIGEEGNEK